MSQADIILDNLTEEEIAALASTPTEEPHIVIDSNRFITVPEQLKRLGVQYDHNIETVTFDMPRYWDGCDLAQMTLYINYMLPSREPGSHLVDQDSITIDPVNPDILHFDWTISGHTTKAKGNLAFLVCAKTVDDNGDEELHWNSELCSDCYISEGLEVTQAIIDRNADVINSLLVKMSIFESGWRAIEADWAEFEDDIREQMSSFVAGTGIVSRYGDTIEGDLEIEGELTTPNADGMYIEEIVEVQGKYVSRQTGGFDTNLFVDQDDRSEYYDEIQISGTDFYVNDGGTTDTKFSGFCPSAEIGKSYVITFVADNNGGDSDYTTISCAGHTFTSGEEFVLTASMANSGFEIRGQTIYNDVEGGVVRGAIYGVCIRDAATADKTIVDWSLSEIKIEGDTLTYGDAEVPIRIQKIQSVGRNLLNIPRNFTFTQACTNLKAIMNLYLPAGKYCLSYDSVDYEGENPPVMVLKNAITNADVKGFYFNKNPQYIDLTDGIYNVRFYSNGWSNDKSAGISATINELMFCRGSSAREYEPYIESEYSFVGTDPSDLGIELYKGETLDLASLAEFKVFDGGIERIIYPTYELEVGRDSQDQPQFITFYGPEHNFLPTVTHTYHVHTNPKVAATREYINNGLAKVETGLRTKMRNDISDLKNELSADISEAYTLLFNGIIDVGSRVFYGFTGSASIKLFNRTPIIGEKFTALYRDAYGSIYIGNATVTAVGTNSVSYAAPSTLAEWNECSSELIPKTRDSEIYTCPESSSIIPGATLTTEIPESRIILHTTGRDDFMIHTGSLPSVATIDITYAIGYKYETHYQLMSSLHTSRVKLKVASELLVDEPFADSINTPDGTSSYKIINFRIYRDASNSMSVYNPVIFHADMGMELTNVVIIIDTIKLVTD